jgi:anaerobic selenocysteine-containing dehydrogenase
VPGGLTLEQIRAQPHGIDMGPMVPRADDGGFRLVSRRHIRSKNSWMHNVKVLVKGKDRCTLLVHPDDAAGVGLVDGGRARVTSEAGASRCRWR